MSEWKKIAPIRSEDDHARALEEINRLMSIAELSASQNAELYLLAAMVEKWEEKNGHYIVNDGR